MFKKDLRKSLLAIFGVAEVTFDVPDAEAFEQDCIFVQIADAKVRPYGKDRISARITGNLSMFSQDLRLTYGFFAKRIEQAPPEERRKFFFGTQIDVTGSASKIQDLDERLMPFTFFFDAQYDPDRGEIDSLDLSLEMEE